MIRVCVMSNAVSGNNRKGLEAVTDRLAAYREVTHHVTRSPEEARALMPALRTEAPEVVVINGGDGTIAATLGLMLEQWRAEDLPLIMLLPGGTANMTAGDIGLASGAARSTGFATGSTRARRWLARTSAAAISCGSRGAPMARCATACSWAPARSCRPRALPMTMSIRGVWAGN
jgi:hypothetical protein